MLFKSVAFRVVSLLVCTLLCSVSFANPLKIIEFDKKLLADLPFLQDSKIAFIDLSAKERGPKITITNIDGRLFESFSIPSDRYSSAWTNWGPGISFDIKNKSIWYLSPQVGLTEFNLGGKVLNKISFPNASHQIQITPERTFVMPYSWDTSSDFQVSEIDEQGSVIFRWKSKDYIEKFAHDNSVAHSQPASFSAATSAVKTSDGNFYLSLSQKNLIIKLNKSGEVVWTKRVSTRPHTLVVKQDNLIGYTARMPNRLVLFNESCACFKEVLIDEAIGGKVNTRSLSLQYLGKGFWFTSGVTGLYIVNDEGKIFWKLVHDGLRGRPIGFHAAVLFND
jgi:hypothetical protein